MSLVRAKEPQGNHGVSTSSGEGSVYGKDCCKYDQNRCLRVGSRAEGAQAYWLNVSV